MHSSLVIIIALIVILVLVGAAVVLLGLARGHKGGAPVEPTAPVAAPPPAPEEETPIPDVGTRDDLAGPPDELTMLKGLGPKAAAELQALGITRFAQLAALDEAGIAAIDARMGTFRGRIARDRWVEQARLLAAGDTAGFEQTFGKLGR